MKRLSVIGVGLLVMGLAVFQFSNEAAGQDNAGWTTLFDGKDLNNWDVLGDANWRIVDGAVQADKGTGFLVSKGSYGDFQLRVEIWVNDGDANSGIFIRCSDPKTVNANTSYEVNVYDKRADQGGRTGSIVNFAKPLANVDAAGKWNTLEITAQGNHLTVSVNGTKTADTMDSKYARGPFGLQYSAGVVKFRKVEIKPL